jgi:hypothetical protein
VADYPCSAFEPGIQEILEEGFIAFLSSPKCFRKSCLSLQDQGKNSFDFVVNKSVDHQSQALSIL